MSDESMRARVGDLQRRLADVEALVTEMCNTTTMAVELTEERERVQVQAEAETQTEAKAPQVKRRGKR